MKLDWYGILTVYHCVSELSLRSGTGTPQTRMVPKCKILLSVEGRTAGSDPNCKIPLLPGSPMLQFSNGYHEFISRDSGEMCLYNTVLVWYTNPGLLKDFLILCGFCN